MLKNLPFMFAAWLMILAVAPLVPLPAIAALVLLAFGLLSVAAWAAERRFLRAWRAGSAGQPDAPPTRRTLRPAERGRLRRRKHADARVERLRRGALDWHNRRQAFLVGMIVAGGVWALLFAL